MIQKALLCEMADDRHTGTCIFTDDQKFVGLALKNSEGFRVPAHTVQAKNIVTHRYRILL
jgi:hypothetical protein